MQGPVRNAALGCAAFPYLDFQDALRGPADILEIHLQRKGTAQLKHAVETDFGLDQDLRRGCGGRENAQKQENGKDVHLAGGVQQAGAGNSILFTQCP